MTASSAFAAVDFSGFTYGGTGCPADGAGIHVQASTSEEGRLIIYIPDMNVSLDNGATFGRKACNIVMPIDVPAGYRLVIGRPSVFGTEHLSSGESLDATASVFMAGSQGPEVKFSSTSNGGDSAEYYRRSQESLTLGCGEVGNLRASTTVLARKNTSVAYGDANVRGIAFDLKVEPCN
jgi:hypothetical protein